MPPPTPPTSPSRTPLDLHASHTLVLAALWACPIVLAVGALLGWPLEWLALVCLIVAAAGAWTLRASIWKPMAQLQSQASRAQRLLGAGTDVLSAAQEARTRLEALEREHATMVGIFNAVQSPLLVVDAQGQTITANAACHAFFASRGPLIGRNLDELFTQPQILRLHTRAVAGEIVSQSLTMNQAEGSRVYLLVAAPTLPSQTSTAGTPPAPSSVVMSFRDITDLAQASALKAAFVANASHELRTPLAAIRIATDTLADGAWDDASMRTRLAEVISDNAQRLDEMVRDLMELSRLESPDMQVSREIFTFAEAQEELARIFASACDERSLALSFEATPKALTLATDRKLFMLILRNLIDNATKFANEHTTIRVVAQMLPPAGNTLRAAPRASLRLKVIDVGLGIPLEHQQRIFERFYQVDSARTGGSARRGTGLGLAIVKHAVKDLGGTIRIESVWKQGTTMIVDLPGTIEP